MFELKRLKKEWAKNNQGISLVEVIVVVLIVGIMASVLIVNIGYVYNTNITRAANELSDLLDLARTQSMSMVEDSLEIRVVRESSNYYVKTYKMPGNVEINSEELCSSSLTISYDVGSGLVSIPPGGFVSISYKKSSGSFITSVKEIQISSGSRTSALVLVKETGRNYLK